MRRAYFDLIGLPPAPDEVKAYAADTKPGAYERMIDRLLASPHYGERWGRHWLDAAGYVDTYGADNDAGTIQLYEGAWRYRDYVVRAFNRDKPFDRFLTEQVAGDELVGWRDAREYTPEILEALTATGFLRTAADSTHAPELNRPLERYQVLHDTLDILGTSLLGLTLGCARCHDHKYDPISQKDYYRLMACFTPAYNVDAWIQPQDRLLAAVPPPERERIDRANAEIDRHVEELKKQLETVKQDPAAAAALNEKIRSLSARRGSYPRFPALWEPGPPPVTRVLLRGDHQAPGPEVEPGAPEVLCPPGQTGLVPAGSEARRSGRRTALARWLTRPDHPLTARVLVNRVWQHHLGQGLVATADNFGRSGARPTHPELLDWLATTFVAPERAGTHGCGWRLKKLHRLIVTSTVYRQASRADAWRGIRPPRRLDPGRVDPENRLLWRQRPRRVESEIARDAVLAASGRLERTLGGPPVPIENRPDGSVVIAKTGLPSPTAGWRRSLYVLHRRNYHLSLLGVFDQPVVSTNCTRRLHSTVPLQALTLLNNEFMFEQADYFAQRVVKLAGNDVGLQVETAFQVAFTRPPSPAERTAARLLLLRQQQRYLDANAPPPEAERKALARLCHDLMCASEFLFVE